MTGLPPWVPVLEEGLARLLARDPRAAERWGALAGRRVGLRLEGLGVALVAVVTPAGVALGPWGDDDEAPDAAITGPPFTLLRLLGEEQPGAHLFGGRVRVHGDQALVQRLRAVLADLDPDLEELAAGLVGDPLAHLAGRGAAALAGWWRAAGRTLADDGRELLEDELELTASAPEVRALGEGVETLRDDVARLAARVALVEKGSAGRDP